MPFDFPAPPRATGFQTLADLPAELFAQIAHLTRSAENPSGIPADAPLPEPTGFHVLLLQDVRPETFKTAGGVSLILVSSTRKEDEFQGRLGLVLKLGPDAYRDEGKFPSGAWVQPGDLVAWPALENASGRYAFAAGTLAVITDDRLTLRECPLSHMIGR